MLCYTTAATSAHFSGILSLQKANLVEALKPEQKQSQGFLTVSHTYDQLKILNDIERHIIATENGRVVAYLLAMTAESRTAIPVLIPMFDMFEKIRYGESTISDFRYIVVGQACVDKEYRGQGIFDKCYQAYRDYFRAKYDFAITEIASTNMRSLAAHKRIGFQEIGSYVAPDKVDWRIVVWNWKANR